MMFLAPADIFGNSFSNPGASRYNTAAENNLGGSTCTLTSSTPSTGAALHQPCIVRYETRIHFDSEGRDRTTNRYELNGGLRYTLPGGRSRLAGGIQSSVPVFRKRSRGRRGSGGRTRQMREESGHPGLGCRCGTNKNHLSTAYEPIDRCMHSIHSLNDTNYHRLPEFGGVHPYYLGV